MSTFALREIKEIRGKQRFDKLVVDDVCLFDMFEQEMSKQFNSEILTIYAYMDQVANLKSLPDTKFHPYDNGDPREYEFKTKHLRVYCIEQKGGKIIILGGKKANQAKDQNYFRSLKRKYVESIKK
jgi:hypothetical protein